jgi:hypothetical protein
LHTGFLILQSNHLLSWKSTKQPIVLLSSTEAEYKALADACKDTVWLKNLCSEIFSSKDPSSASVYVDNRGAIDLALSQISQNGFRKKHMDLCLHFIRDLVLQKIISIKFVGTHSNIANFLTKPVGHSKIVRALSQVTGSSSLSASSLETLSMPACQNDNVAVAMSPDAVMKSICK